MVAYIKNNLLLVLSMLLLLLLLLDSSYGRFTITVSEGEVSAICAKAIDPSFCLKFLKSSPGTNTMDLPGLAKFLINHASIDASNTQKQFTSLASTTTDPHSKGIYTQCSSHYGTAISEFDSALKALEAKDSSTLNIKVSAAMTEGDTCKSELSSVKPNPQVLQMMSDIDKVSSITLVISNMLPKV